MKRKTRISELSRGQERQLRHRDNLWLTERKRIYLYWFTFLQHAERDENFAVDWNKYRGWGGTREVLGSKFDDWWETRWKKLFGMKTENGNARFMLSSRALKANGIRFALLVYEHRNRGSNIEIAQAILKREKRAAYLQSFDLDDKQLVQSRVSRYRRRAKEIMQGVCEGRFTD